MISRMVFLFIGFPYLIRKFLTDIHYRLRLGGLVPDVVFDPSPVEGGESFFRLVAVIKEPLLGVPHLADDACPIQFVGVRPLTQLFPSDDTVLKMLLHFGLIGRIYRCNRLCRITDKVMSAQSLYKLLYADPRLKQTYHMIRCYPELKESNYANIEYRLKIIKVKS